MATAIENEIKEMSIDVKANESEVQKAANELYKKWLLLPADRRGHERRPVELLLGMIPSAADEVRAEVKTALTAAQLTGGRPPSYAHITKTIAALLAAWRIKNPAVNQSVNITTANKLFNAFLPCGGKDHILRECPKSQVLQGLLAYLLRSECR